MINCDINLKAVRSDVYGIVEDYLNDDKATPDDFESGVVNYLNSLKDYNIPDSKVLAEVVFKAITDDGDMDIDEFINVANIQGLIDVVKQGHTLNLSKEATLDKGIPDIEEAQSSKEVSNKFLENAYKSAKAVQLAAEIEANTNFFDAFFINRGSIKGIKGVVSSQTDLNKNIIQYQEQLLGKICNYLKTIGALTAKEQEAVNNPKLYNIVRGEYQNTGILNIITPLIRKYLSPTKVSAEKLRDLYTNRSVGKNKIMLDAFNAGIILGNFDSYIKAKFGKSINIKSSEFGKKTGSLDKYKVANSTAQLATTWRTSENIDVESEIDTITRMLVNTTKIYDWGTSNESGYMNFQYYQNILGKIKELGILPNTKKIFFHGDEEYLGTLSESTQNFIKGKKLSQVINSLRKNPRQYLHSIFEIISNQGFKKAHPEIYSQFEQEELNHIWSVYKQLFSTDLSSIHTLVGIQPRLDYYQFLTQASDSIFKKQFIQYYRDEDGNVRTRVLSDMNKFRLKTKIRSNINAINFNNESQLEAYNTEYNDGIVTFTIPGINNTVAVNVASGRCTYSKDNFLSFAKNKDVLTFLDRTLGLDLMHNSELLEILGRDNMIHTMQRLLNLASNIVATSYISNTQLKELKTKQEKLATANALFGRERSFNRTTKTIDYVDNSDSTRATIEAIVDAQYIQQGMVTATQVKDSNQAGQSLQSLSMLLGSVGSQIDLIESKNNSATNHFSLLNNPDIFLGHYTSSEYYDKRLGKSKKATKFTVSEMAFANIMANFLPAFLESGNHIGYGKASFLASVNSDKGTIGQLLIDLNAQIQLADGSFKAIKDLSTLELKNAIEQDLGDFYIKILEKLDSDYIGIENHIKQNPQYADCPSIAITNFSAFNDWCIRKGKDPESFIKDVVMDYNTQNPLNPIELIDQVHYRTSSVEVTNALGQKIKYNTLIPNKALLGQIARFRPIYADNFGINVNEYVSLDQFFQAKESQILNSLLKNKVIYDLSNSEVKSVVPSNWINASENMILAKADLQDRTGKVQTFPITTSADIRKIAIITGLTEEVILNSPIQLNPILAQYNYLDYWITQQWMNMTVGSFIAHPGKATSANSQSVRDRLKFQTNTLRKEFAEGQISEADYNARLAVVKEAASREIAILQEAAMYQDQHKRNVSMTAQMHEFQLNLLTGITEVYNVAVIEDIKDAQSILMQSNVGIKPYDGATFVNPFTVYLENNSLGGAKAGFDKKQFVHFKNGPTGTGGIIKTAGFGITNDRMRRSPNGWRKMMEQMTNRIWLKEDGSPITIDITKGFNNRSIKFNPIYFAKNGEQFQITNFQNIGPNTYTRTISLVDNRGNIIKELTAEELATRNLSSEAIIDSNFKLWEFFGGEYSLKVGERGTLVPSEASIEYVVDYMNKVGTPKHKQDGSEYSVSEIETQEQLWQPLKQSDIHYLATAGAVKQGAANINSRSKYGTNQSLNFQRILMYQAGIQLDKEHHADNAELSLPTQIISACASLGYTIDKATSLYEGLAQAAELGTKTLFEVTEAYFTKNTIANRNALQEEVLKLVAKNMSTSNSDSFAKVIAESVMEAVKKDPKLKFREVGLPLSDNSVFAKMLSTISSHISREGIKLKIPGLLAVLSPTHNLFTLKGNRTWDSLYNWSSKDEALVAEYLEANPDNTITDRQELLLAALQWNQTPIFSAEIIDGQQNNSLHKIDLGRYYTITYSDGRVESIFINTPKDLRALITQAINGEILKVVEDITKDRNLGAYNVRFRTTSGEYFQLWDLDSIYYVHEVSQIKTEEIFKEWFKSEFGHPTNINKKEFLKFWNKQIQKDLAALSKSTNSSDPVRIGGKLYNIIKESLDVQAYELIMPKVYLEHFGFEEFTDLNEVREDKDYFVKQYIRNQNNCNGKPKPRENQFDIELKNSNGKHIYLLDAKHLKDSGLTESIDEILTKEIDGKIVRIDTNENELYEILEGTKIYIDRNGNEVIVVEDTENQSAIQTMNQYVEQLSFDLINISQNLGQNEDYLLELVTLLERNKKVGKYISEYITPEDEISGQTILANLKKLVWNNITEDNYKKYYNEIQHIIRAGHRKHTAFLKSLDIVAARIPSQSLQSFMPMKVVAYDNPNRNAAYVSNLQLLLQGSDLKQFLY